MDRRAFLAGTGAVLLAAPLAAEAQPPKKIPQVGYLGFVENPELDAAFQKALRELGYVEGQNIRLEYRYAGGNVERLREFAAELVRLKGDVIVASGTQAIEAVRPATKTIPIVFPVTFDPVQSGFVASLARPGGNLTGLTGLTAVVTGKRVELLKELIPHLSRVAVLRNPTSSASVFALKETETAARRLNLRLQALEARNPGDLEGAFQAATRERVGALLILSDNLFQSHQGRIGTLGIQHRLPQVSPNSAYVKAGGLMSYGTNLPDLYRRAATYVDKILKGAQPADIPVEQATKFDLVINLKTAKALGLTIPQSLLLRADEVIQ